MKDFARGCIRSYLILKDKAARWNADPEIQAILTEIERDRPGVPIVEKYSESHVKALLAYSFDRIKIGKRRLPYERLDQLTIDLLLGVRDGRAAGTTPTRKAP